MLVVVPAATVVFGEQMADKLRRHDIPIEERRTGQMVPQEAAERTAEPMGQRNAKAAFWLLEQLLRQTIAHGKAAGALEVRSNAAGWHTFRATASGLAGAVPYELAVTYDGPQQLEEI